MKRAETIATLWSQNRETLGKSLSADSSDDEQIRTIFEGDFSAEEITNYRKQLVERIKELQDIAAQKR